MMDFANGLALVAQVVLFTGLLAFVVERLVEHFVKPLLDMQGWHVATPYVALALGLAFSLLFRIDLFTPLAVAVGLQPLTPWAGLTLSGLVVGGGSNFLSDIWPGQGGSTFAMQTTSPEKSASTTDVVVRTSQDAEE